MIKGLRVILGTLKRLFWIYRKPSPDFCGSYTSFNQVQDENPWVAERWIAFNRTKLEKLSLKSHELIGQSLVPKDSHIVIPAVILNLLGSGRILDFGGGTGYTYFALLGYLQRPKNYDWIVYDSNKLLYEVGQSYLLGMGVGGVRGIKFAKQLPDGIIRAINISSTLQYIEDCYQLLGMLVDKYDPEYFFLTRTCCGEINSFITKQLVYGKATPMRFINSREIEDFFFGRGYEIVFKGPCGSFKSTQFFGIEKSQQISHAIDYVMRKIKD